MNTIKTKRHDEHITFINNLGTRGINHSLAH